MGRLLQDAAYAVRLLRRQPSFTIVAIFTLALGIGATTAVFTVVYGVLLRPLPYRDPGRLVTLQYGHRGNVSPWFSPLNFRDYTSRNSAFAATAAIAPIVVNATGDGGPERLRGARVSWNYFDVIGAAIAHGRAFSEADDLGDGNRVVLSDGLWRRRFGGRADIIGSSTTLNGRPAMIVGVATADLKFPVNAEFWQPLIFAPAELAPASRGAQWLQVLARLNEGVTPQQATIALQTTGDQLAQEFAEFEKDVTVRAISLHDRIAGDVRTTLVSVLGAVMLVLLIACANVASLLLARAQSRDREVAVRMALGATRGRMMAQLLTESLVLGAAGAAAGVGIAALLVRALVLIGPASIPRLADLTIDAVVLAFTAAAAVITSIAFGLAPAAAMPGRPRDFSLGSRGAVGHRTTTTRRALVVAELAIAAMLLIGSGLLVRSYLQLQRVEPGFDPEGVVTFGVALPASKYPESAHLDAFVSAMLSRISTGPAVQSAAVAVGLPFANDLDAITGFRRDDRPEPDSASRPSASLRIVSPGYFKTIRLPIRRGRGFDDRDTAAASEVALINERAAQRYFAGEDPIGKQIRISAQLARDARSGSKTIVGIVGDVKYRGLDEESPAEIYLPYDQHRAGAFTVAVRTAGDPLAVVRALRSDVASVDPLLPLANVAPLTALVDSSIAARRFTMLLFLSFAGIAAALAAIGVYSVLAYLVSQRTREIGVRLALGASPADVIWLFVREGLALTAAGLTAGLAGALAAGQSIRALLFEVAPADPATFAGVACLLTFAAGLAVFLPARRAAHGDPTLALRYD